MKPGNGPPMAERDTDTKRREGRPDEQGEGRYGTADAGAPHIEPEARPVRGADAPARVPREVGFPGLLAENSLERPDARIDENSLPSPARAGEADVESDEPPDRE